MFALWRNKNLFGKSLDAALGPHGADDEAYRYSHENFKKSMEGLDPSAARGDEHYDRGCNDGVAVSTAFQPERRQKDSNQENARAERQHRCRRNMIAAPYASGSRKSFATRNENYGDGRVPRRMAQRY